MSPYFFGVILDNVLWHSRGVKNYCKNGVIIDIIMVKYKWKVTTKDCRGILWENILSQKKMF